MKTNRISRIIHILTTLQSGRNYTASDLAKIFKRSRRTIFRDLKELGVIGLPFRYDSKTKGYSLNAEFFLPPVDLNLQEALSLLLLAHKAEGQIQMPFASSLFFAISKIENNLPLKIKQFCNTALMSISIKAGALAKTKQLDTFFEKLQHAILTKHKVRLCYNSLFDGGIINIVLCPYHLLYNQRAWYVLGHSSLHKSVRTFKLNRIEKIMLLDKCFLSNEDFDLYDHFGNAWSMIPEGRLYNIKLKFLPKVANNVAEVQWHPTQKVQYSDDGSIIVEFRIDGLGEISWWILGYGNQVQVLAPKALREKIQKTAKEMVLLNE